MSYQPRSTNPYIMEKKLNECVGGGGFDPSVLEEIEAEISTLGSQNETQAQDIIDIKGSLNSINDNLAKTIVLSKTGTTGATYADIWVDYQNRGVIPKIIANATVNNVIITLNDVTESGCQFIVRSTQGDILTNTNVTINLLVYYG